MKVTTFRDSEIAISLKAAWHQAEMLLAAIILDCPEEKILWWVTIRDNKDEIVGVLRYEDGTFIHYQ